MNQVKTFIPSVTQTVHNGRKRTPSLYNNGPQLPLVQLLMTKDIAIGHPSTMALSCIGAQGIYSNPGPIFLGSGLSIFCAIENNHQERNARSEKA